MPLKNLLRANHGKLYVEIAGLLRQKISSGEWEPGEQIPTLDTLADTYGVALVTIRQAMALIETEGLLFRRQGKGTFVTHQVRDKQKFFLRLESDWQSLVNIAHGARPTMLRAGDALKVPGLEPDDGRPASSYFHMKRVHVSGDTAYGVLDIYLDRKVYLKSPRKFETELVIPILERMTTVRLKSARQTLTIGTADMETAEHLGVAPNSPIGIVKRVVQNYDGIAVYVAFAKYRGDLVRLDRHIVKTNALPETGTPSRRSVKARGRA